MNDEVFGSFDEDGTHTLTIPEIKHFVAKYMVRPSPLPPVHSLLSHPTPYVQTPPLACQHVVRYIPPPPPLVAFTHPHAPIHRSRPSIHPSPAHHLPLSPLPPLPISAACNLPLRRLIPSPLQAEEGWERGEWEGMSSLESDFPLRFHPPPLSSREACRPCTCARERLRVCCHEQVHRRGGV